MSRHSTPVDRGALGIPLTETHQVVLPMALIPIQRSPRDAKEALMKAREDFREEVER